MADTKDTIEFSAEVKEVSSKKTASLDVTYKVVLLTDNSKVLALGMLPGDAEYKVSIAAKDNA